MKSAHALLGKPSILTNRRSPCQMGFTAALLLNATTPGCGRQRSSGFLHHPPVLVLHRPCGTGHNRDQVSTDPRASVETPVIPCPMVQPIDKHAANTHQHRTDRVIGESRRD